MTEAPGSQLRTGSSPPPPHNPMSRCGSGLHLQSLAQTSLPGKNGQPSFERAVKKEFNAQTDRWDSWNALVHIAPGPPFGRGSFRTAHKAILQCENEPPLACVAKYLSPRGDLAQRVGPVNRLMYLDDAFTQATARVYSLLFNAKKPPKPVTVVSCWVVELIERPGSPLVLFEPELVGPYRKYSDNWGGCFGDRHTPQAFSHFTYEESDHQLLVCDVQGVGDFYTDLQIHTINGKGYGVGNKGRAGIARFIQSHVCNCVCTSLGLPPLQPLVPPSPNSPWHASTPTTLAPLQPFESLTPSVRAPGTPRSGEETLSRAPTPGSVPRRFGPLALQISVLESPASPRTPATSTTTPPTIPCSAGLRGPAIEIRAGLGGCAIEMTAPACSRNPSTPRTSSVARSLFQAPATEPSAPASPKPQPSAASPNVAPPMSASKTVQPESIVLPHEVLGESEVYSPPRSYPKALRQALKTVDTALAAVASVESELKAFHARPSTPRSPARATVFPSRVSLLGDERPATSPSLRIPPQGYGREHTRASGRDLGLRHSEETSKCSDNDSSSDTGSDSDSDPDSSDYGDSTPPTTQLAEFDTRVPCHGRRAFEIEQERLRQRVQESRAARGGNGTPRFAESSSRTPPHESGEKFRHLAGYLPNEDVMESSDCFLEEVDWGAFKNGSAVLCVVPVPGGGTAHCSMLCA